MFDKYEIKEWSFWNSKFWTKEFACITHPFLSLNIDVYIPIFKSNKWISRCSSIIDNIFLKLNSNYIELEFDTSAEAKEFVDNILDKVIKLKAFL